MRLARSLPTGAVALAFLLLAACGADDPEAGTRSPDPVVESAEPTEAGAGETDEAREAGSGAGTTLVEVIDTDFRPVTITIDQGSKVAWEQVGDQPHSVTAKDGSFDSSPDCGPLESDKCLGQGDSFSHTFEKPGEYTYYCRVHGLPDGTGMVGSIVVR